LFFKNQRICDGIIYFSDFSIENGKKFATKEITAIVTFMIYSLSLIFSTKGILKWYLLRCEWESMAELVFFFQKP
jgi:hypothetical protein